jgi:hypothetical protein
VPSRSGIAKYDRTLSFFSDCVGFIIRYPATTRSTKKS